MRSTCIFQQIRRLFAGSVLAVSTLLLMEGCEANTDAPHSIEGGGVQFGPISSDVRLPSFPNPGPQVELGSFVSVDGNYVLVGTETTSHIVTKAAGSDSTNAEAYLYRRSESGRWKQVEGLQIPNGRSGGGGALDEERAVITTIEGAGAAYVFEKDSSGAWPRTAVLRPPEGRKGLTLGRSVALQEDCVLVEGGFSVGPMDDRFEQGTAFVFEKDEDGTWERKKRLQPSTANVGDRVGSSVALDENTAVLGAPGKEKGTWLLFGYANGTGAAYVFRRSASGWTASETAVLRASDGQNEDHFGASVDIEGEQILVGAPFDVSATGPVSDDEGTVYAFEQSDGNSWREIQQLRAFNAGKGDEFGISVAVRGRWAVVTAVGEDGPMNRIPDAGAAYTFKRDERGTWRQRRILRPSDVDSDARFGSAVALGKDEVAVSALPVGPVDSMSRLHYQLESEGTVSFFDRKSLTTE